VAHGSGDFCGAHEDSWKVVIMTEGPQDAERCDMIETIADRLRSQFDLKN
jgi:hypothetical protein